MTKATLSLAPSIHHTGHESVKGSAARVGPNAIIQMAAALHEEGGEALATSLLKKARLRHYLAEPPSGMVPESEVIALHRAVREHFDHQRAEALAARAGRLTGDYVMANRIPASARFLLHLMPQRFAAILLLKAITQHAWTFSGTGHFTVENNNPVRVSLANNPLCRGLKARTHQCVYYAATFEQLFSGLVASGARCTETACEAVNGPKCTFEIKW